MNPVLNERKNKSDGQDGNVHLCQGALINACNKVNLRPHFQKKNLYQKITLFILTETQGGLHNVQETGWDIQCNKIVCFM